MAFSIGHDAFTTFGLPPDGVAWFALGVALACYAAPRLFPHGIAWHGPVVRKRMLVALAGCAALLSLGYVQHYLRGGPRVIDATSYWLEARALAHGELSFPVLAPTGSFRGRFLVTPPGESSLSVIFPPGWPLVLALGIKIGAPFAVGAGIAAALVLATYSLARALFADERLALCAAALSVVCAALRYHTADTMSHGWSALLLCVALAAALRRSARSAVLAGVAAGLLLATRPVSGVVALIVSAGAACFHRPRESWRGALGTLLLLALGAVPGVVLLALHQRAATGSWLQSSQYYYYALADGPPGCFRYGFGDGIGCMHEHRDVALAALQNGYSGRVALVTSLHRSLLNLIDVANAEPLALVLILGAALERRKFGVRLLAGAIGLLLVAYAPFYFPGSYPGGGARLLADALPLEHVLLAAAAARLRIVRHVCPVALAGFALHTSYAHRALAEREGGRPMYEPALLARAGVTRGLVFVNTDHAFNLGHDPHGDPEREVLVARFRKDAHDSVLWERLGRPPSYVYRFDPFDRSRPPAIRPYEPILGRVARYEAENEWPPLGVSAGFAYPAFASNPCVSGGRGLRIFAGQQPSANITIEVFAPATGTYQLTSSWLPEGSGLRQVRLRLAGQAWSVSRNDTTRDSTLR